MICSHCGAANEDKARFCGRCHAELSLPAEGGPEEVKPSWDITRISSRNVFQENIINQRFKIIKVLGRGGMGEIYLAEDNKLNRKVAIKSINSELIREHEAKTRFRREAQAASLLDHPNICAIHGIAQENEREYIIMQYVDGVTLEQLQKMKLLSLGTIVDIALQISEGMIAAQAQNILHRDIKPGNIMIDKSGMVKILDFGLAKIYPGKMASKKNSRPETGLTQKGFVLGSVSYMSPEQAAGRELDGRSDIFSFGVVLYELLERKNPFADQENIITLYNILHKEIKLSPDIPKALQKIVHKTLQKDRERRYNDFWEIKNDLAAARDLLLQNKKEQAKAPGERIPVSKSRKLWLALAALLALVVLLALAV